MKQIFKHILEILPVQRVGLPIGSKFLSVEEQHEDIVVYTLCEFEEISEGSNKQASKEFFDIFVKKTGEPSYDINDCRFLGTVKLFEGKCMYHVFYRQVKK